MIFFTRVLTYINYTELNWYSYFANRSKTMMEPIIVVHGGAGNIPDSSDQAKFDGILTAVRKAYALFKCTSSIIDACQAAVEHMEIDKAFNAGRGSVLNLKGEIEMEALIMEGKDMKAGKPIQCHVSSK